MKDQYFGDINDYRKYGLLRLLASVADTPLTVCWMLTPSDGRNDGSSVSYLLNPGRWRRFDPVLFDALRGAVHNGQRLGTATAPRLRIFRHASFHASILSDNAPARVRYFDELTALSRTGGLLFFDPDNGMEVRSVPYGRRNSSKYLYWRELERFTASGHSVLIYQHFPRRERFGFMRHLAGEFIRRLNIRECLLFQSSRVVFVLLPRKGTEMVFHGRSRAVAERWRGELRVVLFSAAGEALREEVIWYPI